MCMISCCVLQWYPSVTQCEPTDMAPVSIGKHFFLTYDLPIYGKLINTYMHVHGVVVINTCI